MVCEGVQAEMDGNNLLHSPTATAKSCDNNTLQEHVQLHIAEHSMSWCGFHFGYNVPKQDMRTALIGLCAWASQQVNEQASQKSLGVGKRASSELVTERASKQANPMIDG